MNFRIYTQYRVVDSYKSITRFSATFIPIVICCFIIYNSHYFIFFIYGLKFIIHYGSFFHVSKRKGLEPHS